MTGTGGWAYFSATRYILGMKPQFDHFVINPCIPGEWDGFTCTREWRGAVFCITVKNPEHVMKGVKEIVLDGEKTEKIPVQEKGSTHEVVVILGK